MYRFDVRYDTLQFRGATTVEAETHDEAAAIAAKVLEGSLGGEIAVQRITPPCDVVRYVADGQGGVRRKRPVVAR